MGKYNGKSVKNVSIPSLTRRGFLEVNAKLAALAGAGSMVVSNAPKVFAMGGLGRPSVEAGPAGVLDQEEIYVSSCCVNCISGKCPHYVHVKNGRIVRDMPEEEGDPEDAWIQPQLRGCSRGRSNKFYVYHPYRVKYPLERTGTRGSGEFRRVSWDYALDKAAKELKRVKETYGPQAIVAPLFGEHASGIKETSMYGIGMVIPTLIACLGPISVSHYEPSYAGGAEGHLGGQLGSIMQGASDYRQIAEYSNFVILLSVDHAMTRSVMNHFRIQKVKERLIERGVKVVGIDPRLNYGFTSLIDEWFPIRPGTDVALAASMAYVILTEGLVDRKIIDRYTVGFDKYEAYILSHSSSDDPEVKRWVDGIPKTPEWGEKITGAPAAKIRELAIDYATKKPAAFLYGWAPARGALGETYHRAFSTLAFMTGNVGQPGTWADCDGNMLWHTQPYSLKYLGPLISTFIAAFATGGTLLTLADLLKATKCTMIPSWYFGKVLNNPGMMMNYNVPAPDIRAIVGTQCPLGTYPDTSEISRGYKNPRIEFICHSDVTMTGSCRHADIVLPAAHMYEREDIFTANVWLTQYPGTLYEQRVVKPLWENKEDMDIWKEFARRFGKDYIYDAFPSFDTIARNIVNMSRALDPEHPTYEEMKSGKRPVYKGSFSKTVSVPSAYNNQINKGLPFGTPSGKYEIYSEYLERETNSPHLRNMTWRQNDFPGWKDMKYCVPALPVWRDHWEGVTDPLRKKYPYQMINPRASRSVNTHHPYNPLIEDIWGPWDAWINARDAASKGVRNGDIIEVFNGRGRVRTKAFVTERIMPGVVALDHGKWPYWENGVDLGGSGDALTRSEFAGIPGKGMLVMLSGAATNTNLVDFIKVADASEDEKYWENVFYTFKIDEHQQTIDEITGQFVEDVTWDSEKK